MRVTCWRPSSLEELVNLCLAMLTAPGPGVGRRRIPRLAWRQRPGQPSQG